jgi:hypothetical protein
MFLLCEKIRRHYISAPLHTNKRNRIAWLTVGVWKLRAIRRGTDEGAVLCV